MYKIKGDLHTHTIVSGHASGTFYDTAAAAKAKGLDCMAVTDHYSGAFLPGFPEYEPEFSSIPKEISGVKILSGAEIDIVDFNGNLAGYDAQYKNTDHSYLEALLETMDIVIASVHWFEGFNKESELVNTKMFLAATQNPQISFIGHMGRVNIPFELDVILKASKEIGKPIEINNHSFHFDGIYEKCRAIAYRAAELGVNIVVSSDAHAPNDVGDFSLALGMLKEIDFPETLIANRSWKFLSECFRLR